MKKLKYSTILDLKVACIFLAITVILGIFYFAFHSCSVREAGDEISEAYHQGYNDGYIDAEWNFKDENDDENDSDYDDGYEKGYEAGYAEGYEEGYAQHSYDSTPEPDVDYD